MRYLVGLFVFCCLVQTAFSIECHHCWPPSEESVCKRSTKRIDCRPFKNIGYDRCIEVRFHGNKTLSRTCYTSHLCDGAREWCRRYGPCTVKCCDFNMCNTASTSKYLSIVQLLIPLMTLKWISK